MHKAFLKGDWLQRDSMAQQKNHIWTSQRKNHEPKKSKTLIRMIVIFLFFSEVFQHFFYANSLKNNDQKSTIKNIR